MKINIKLIAGTMSILAVMAGTAKSASAWSYTGSGQWASVNYGAWTVYQDEWGSTASCYLYANNAGNWATAGSWTGGGTKGYAHVQSSVLNYDINSYWFVSGFNVSPPSGAVYDYMYDMWTANMADELIVIENSNTGGTWGSKIYSNVTIAGRLYSSIWKASNGANPVIIFVPASMRNSGNEDCMAYFKWASSKGLLHNNQLREVSFGVEQTSTNGWQQFTTNSFWGSYGHN